MKIQIVQIHYTALNIFFYSCKASSTWFWVITFAGKSVFLKGTFFIFILNIKLFKNAQLFCTSQNSSRTSSYP